MGSRQWTVGSGQWTKQVKRQRAKVKRQKEARHCNTVDSCFLGKNFARNVGPKGVRPASLARTRGRATGIPPVPEHGLEGRGTPLVAAPPHFAPMHRGGSS